MKLDRHWWLKRVDGKMVIYLREDIKDENGRGRFWEFGFVLNELQGALLADTIEVSRDQIIEMLLLEGRRVDLKCEEDVKP